MKIAIIVRTLAVRGGIQRHVRTDPSQFRPRDVHELRGDATKARAAFGWESRVRFPELVKIMVEVDLARYGVVDAMPMRQAV